MIKYCELDEFKICDDCGECKVCDLNRNKICDNCCTCIGLSGVDYRAVEIDNVQDGINCQFTEGEVNTLLRWVEKRQQQ